MSIPAHVLRGSLDDALEVVAVADTARDLGLGALGEVLTLPEPHRTQLLNVLRQCWTLNAEIIAAGQRLSRTLDELARVAHRDQGSVKELAADLRPHLTALNDLIAANTVDRLAGGGMRRALGPNRHALLMDFARNGQLRANGGDVDEGIGVAPTPSGGLS